MAQSGTAQVLNTKTVNLSLWDSRFKRKHYPESPGAGVYFHPMRYLIIFNRKAGNFSPWEVGKITEILSSSPRLEGEVVVTGTLAELREVLTKHQNTKIDLLGIGGGDGTASLVLTEAMNVWKSLPPYIVPFPCGTVGNYVAEFGLSTTITDKLKKKLHLPSTKSIRTAQYLLKTINQQKPLHTEPLDLLDINGTKGFTLGLGIVPKILWLYYGGSIAEYHEHTQHTKPADLHAGPFYSALTLLRIIFCGPLPFTRIHFFLTDHTTVTVRKKRVSFLAFIAASHAYISLGINNLALKPTYRARERRGKFHAVWYPLTLWQALRQLPRLLQGKHLQRSIEELTGEQALTSDQPLVYQVDGELLVDKKITVKYDQTLRIVSPFTQ